MPRVEQQYIDLFREYRNILDEHSSAQINQYRDMAFHSFEEQGFPKGVEEDYKHSNIAKMFSPNMGINLRNIPFPMNPYEVFKCDVPRLSTDLHFLLNDRYYDHQQSDVKRPEKVFIGSLQRFSKEYPQQFAAHYGKIACVNDNGIIAYNTMFAQDGFVIYVPENTHLSAPVQLINILRGNVDLNVNRRLLIIAEKGADVQLLVCDHTVDNVQFVTTQVVEVYAGEFAKIDYCELEENSYKVHKVNNIYFSLQAGANLSAVNFTLNNGMTRNNFNIKLQGPHAEANLGGLAICDKKQHIDNYTLIDHAVTDCNSNQLFKNVLQDYAVGSFSGRVIVEPNAQRTNAYQVNRNLCTTPRARVFSKPQLEIHADDVKCSHGLTIGQMDDDELFYMCARGIEEKEAKLMLMAAFTDDVVSMVHFPTLKERLAMLIDKRFRGELMRCGGCNVCKWIDQ